MYRAVLFDLDGTLADTAPDLAHALNLLLERHRRRPLPLETVRPHASHGASGLLGVGFGITPQDPAFAPLRDEYLALYASLDHQRTRLFDGMGELLAQLATQGLPWGIVTNKPERFTLPLLHRLGLREHAATVIGGDTCAHPKPHPEPMLRAAREIGLPSSECLYLGDAERDILAARNAGMDAIVAAWGYLGPNDRPQNWNAHGIIRRPLDTLAYLDANAV
jgi:phosphoglycolate phosphatase